jgi:hypothetical protein
MQGLRIKKFSCVEVQYTVPSFVVKLLVAEAWRLRSLYYQTFLNGGKNAGKNPGGQTYIRV